MQTFNLSIDLGNDAMQTREDIAAALVKLAEKVATADEGRIRDENGNTVGRWELS